MRYGLKRQCSLLYIAFVHCKNRDNRGNGLLNMGLLGFFAAFVGRMATTVLCCWGIAKTDKPSLDTSTIDFLNANHACF